MQKSTSFIFICLSLVFACQTQPKVDAENSNLKTEQEKDSVVKTESVPTSHNSIQGEWILTDFVDSFVVKKSFYEVTRSKMCCSAIYMDIQADTIFSAGKIFDDLRPHILQKGKETKVEFLGDIYLLKYDSLNNLITATTTQDEETEDNKTYIFRRINPEESKLIESAKESNFPYNFVKNFTSKMIRPLFLGTFVGINNEIKFTLNDKGLISGFENFNEYKISNYFGTFNSHPPYDGIFLRDTTKEHFPPENLFSIELYSWKFKSDTLILKKMKSTGDFHVLTNEKELYFLKE